MVDANVLPLYYLCAFGGLVMVVGGVWLLQKKIIRLDRDSKGATEIPTPLGVIKTNAPALALFGLGFIPLIYPVHQLAGATKHVRVHGAVKANAHPISIYAVAQANVLRSDGEFSLKLPLLSDAEDYKILYLVGNNIVEVDVNPTKHVSGEIRLKDQEVNLPETARLVGDVAPRPAEFRPQ